VTASVAGCGGSRIGGIIGEDFLLVVGSVAGSRLEMVKMWLYRLQSLMSSRASR